MPRLRPETARRRRKRIIEAALRCFAERGVHDTTMADIIAEAGMSAGSVYSWFQGKEDIIEAAYRGSGRPSADRMQSALAADPRDGICEVLRTAARKFDDPRWRRTSRVNLQIWGHALFDRRVRDSFLGDFATYRQLIADAAARLQQSGDLDQGVDPERVAAVLWGLYLGLEAQKAWEPDLDAIGYVETALVLMSLLPPDAAPTGADNSGSGLPTADD